MGVASTIRCVSSARCFSLEKEGVSLERESQLPRWLAREEIKKVHVSIWGCDELLLCCRTLRVVKSCVKKCTISTHIKGVDIKIWVCNFYLDIVWNVLARPLYKSRVKVAYLL